MIFPLFWSQLPSSYLNIKFVYQERIIKDTDVYAKDFISEFKWSVMETNTNRVIEGMQEWLQREENISRLFSPATLRSRYFQELKLDYLRDLHQQIRKDASKDERMTLRILKGERKQLERALYPNVMMRLARRVYKIIKQAFDKRKGIEIGEKTGWMMQVARNDTKKTEGRSRHAIPQRNVKHEMVSRRQSSPGKGLKL